MSSNNWVCWSFPRKWCIICQMNQHHKNKLSAVRLINSFSIETIILIDRGIVLRESVKNSFCGTRNGTVLITFHRNGTGRDHRYTCGTQDGAGRDENWNRYGMRDGTGHKIRRPADLCKQVGNGGLEVKKYSEVSKVIWSNSKSRLSTRK